VVDPCLGRDEGLYLDICARVPEFLVTPLLMGLVCLARAGLKSQSVPVQSSYSTVTKYAWKQRLNSALEHLLLFPAGYSLN